MIGGYGRTPWVVSGSERAIWDPICPSWWATDFVESSVLVALMMTVFELRIDMGVIYSGWVFLVVGRKEFSTLDFSVRCLSKCCIIISDKFNLADKAVVVTSTIKSKLLLNHTCSG